ncbi:MAG: O-antigen ligase family protein, partial [Halobacteria archaeon]
LVFALVSSVEFSLSSGSSYVSINSEDFAVLAVLVVYILTQIKRGYWNLRLTMPQTTGVLGILTFWITITTVLAVVQLDAGLLSFLWLFKLFEVFVLFGILQDQLDKFRGLLVCNGLVLSGSLLGMMAIFQKISGGRRRAQVFFDNPNTLSTFLVLLVVLSLGLLLHYEGRYRLFHSSGVVLGALGIFTTGSRSGLLGLVVGLSVFLVLVLSRRDIETHRIPKKGIGLGVIGVLLLVPYLLPDLWRRLTGWFRIMNGKLVLTDTSAAQPIQTRIRLFNEAIGLFQNRPIFGYGWFASPGRVGYLDIHYTTLPVELGFLGFILYLLFYIMLVKDGLRVVNNGPFFLGAALVSWFIAILVQSIGGNFLRAPQVLMITLLFFTAVKSTEIR